MLAEFVKEAWYVAAWEHEVQRLSLYRRLVLGEPIVLYRTPEGRAVALEDRCCHRHAPLSHGTLRGDRVVCAYHGLEFDPTGACVRVPSQNRIPQGARIRSYPVVEKDHFVWIWTGDPADADPALVPDFLPLRDPAYRWRGERLHVEGNYVLIIENLMDLTHLPVLHATTLASSTIPDNEIPVCYSSNEREIRVDRRIEGTAPPPYFRMLAGFEPNDRVDRWMNTRFEPPGSVFIDIGAALSGTNASGSVNGRRVGTWNLNAITPETLTTTHYFWAQALDFADEDASISELDFQLVRSAFLEDLAIIKGQQENLDLDPGVPRVNLAADKAGVQARRLLQSMIKPANCQ